MKQNQYAGPLAGLNVLDFGHYYAGTMAGLLLADQGANVIRIVKPGNKELPEQQFRLLNRNKKLLELDLKSESESGKKQAQALIAKADVVIENFRPGVMARLGLDYASVKATNPALIYLSLPGFASIDTARAGIQAWEGVVAAAAGMYTECHLFRQKLDFPPVYTWVPLCSAFAAMHGAVAVMAALIARQKYNQGTCIEVPLVEAGLSLFADQFMVKGPMTFKEPSMPLRALAPDQAPLPEQFQHLKYSPQDTEKQQLEKLEKAHDEMQRPFFYQLYKTADDRLFLTHSANNPQFTARYFKALGIYAQLREEGYYNDGVWAGNAQGNNLSSAFDMSLEKRQRVVELMSQAYRQKTGDEWEQILADADVPGNYIRSREEWLTLEPMHQSGVLTTLGEGEQALKVPGRVVDVSGPDGALMDVRPRDAKLINVDEALADFSISAATKPKPSTPASQQVLHKGDLLKGLKVVDLANIVAGPTAAYTLAQFGADVIKADAPDAGLTRMLIWANQGKRSILLDVRTAPGRQAFERLLGWADLVSHNILDDTARRLGIAHDQLQQINPRLVSSQLTAFGGTLRGCGGWENRRGFDPLAQNASGVMVDYGSMEYPQDHGSLSADIMGGVSLAFSSLLGIYQRNQTGYAGETRASLARAITFNQLPGMIMQNGNCDWGEPKGQFARGCGWQQRIYACADGWIYVGASEQNASRFAQLIMGKQLSETESVDESAIAALFAENSCQHWLQQLSDAGIACQRVITVDELCEAVDIRRVSNENSDECAEASPEILRWDNHPSGNPVILKAPSWVRVSEQQSWYRLKPGPNLGANSREILKELGYADSDIAELVRLKVAHDYYPALGPVHRKG